MPRYAMRNPRGTCAACAHACVLYSDPQLPMKRLSFSLDVTVLLCKSNAVEDFEMLCETSYTLRLPFLTQGIEF